MQEGQNARQQIVERIRQSTSILVALSNNPSVDALAASLGLSLMLTKMNKHSTAVFSGVIPPAIQFLEPNKTFENNVDALRDFIISLDKEKADRLRYKVEDDVVRIFITPYKTSISEKDLQYSQGDFNVDLIIALGVEKRDDLDKAVIAHGRILHDATVVTVNPNNIHSSLGAIDWNDAQASSICEMLVSMSEAFQQPGLLDQQISTALLTGIVAATERFSNTHTSPRVMTMAAQLMAAGANQQLIATNLSKVQETAAPVPIVGTTLAKQPAGQAPTPMQEEPVKKKEPGELDIEHPKAPEPPKEEKPAPAPLPPAPAPEKTAEQELEEAMPATAAPSHSFIELKDELEGATKKAAEDLEGPKEPKAPGSASVNGAEDEEGVAKEPDHAEDYISSHGSWKGKRLEPPSLGGTLNATAEEALIDEQKAEDEDRNKTLLTHPEDRQQNNQSKRNKGKKDRDQKPAPAPAPEPTPAPKPEPAPVIPPAPAPEPPVAPAVPELPPLPPMPSFGPEPSAPAPAPAPLPPAPAPELITPPALEPAPAPLPEPTSEPNLDALHQEVAASAAEAAAAAQPASAAAGEIDSARQAVSNALDAAPFNPANNPQQSVGSQEVPPMPNVPVSEPLSQADLQALPPAPAPTPVAPTPAPGPNDLPPLPPMPPLPSSDTALPPAPNLPGLNQPLPPMAPDVTQTPPPPPAPADPGQFKIPGA